MGAYMALANSKMVGDDVSNCVLVRRLIAMSWRYRRGGIRVLGLQVIGFGLVGEIVIFTQARNVREYRVERVYE